MQKLDGFFPLYWDAKTGRLLMEIDKWNVDFLFYESMPAGLGSNDTGLDRGLLGSEKVVYFERSGPKVLLVQRNLEYRANSPDAAERKAVEDSFARSVLWGFGVEGEENNKVLVDVTNFVVRDGMGVANRLRRANQGTWRLDGARSAVYLPRTKAFPKNTEMEATITFAGENPGNFVASVTPTPDALTLRVHYSFLELPGPGYEPREFDPRSGYNAITFLDFASPVDQPIRKRFIPRHRLAKKDPSAAVSEAVKPLIYYVDRGTPEPIRTALLEGARWWNQAFEAAGYRNAFQVEVMPEDADPMDARYNIIQWVHRSTRGWSYGASVTDPRTGEILKGHVTLGSLRIRQDFLIAEGLLAPYTSRDVSTKPMMDMALARIRQLSTHEVGHTLGLVHNFASSAFNRASVMDYPHPKITLNPDGRITLEEAYTAGVGEFDKVAIAYGYQHFPPGTNERAALRKILDDAQKRGLYLIADSDSRAPGGAHPRSHLWDNGEDPVAELEHMLKVRAQAISRFGEQVIPFDTPLSEIEAKLVPIYLSHRYQVEAVAKILGGLDYRYALRGDGQPVAPIVDPAWQRRALQGSLDTLRPENLTLPETLLAVMPPPALGFPRTRENFRGRTGLTFDALAPAEAVANLVFGLLLHPERASRLEQHFARNGQNPRLQEVLRSIEERLAPQPAQNEFTRQVLYAARISYLFHLMALTQDARTAPAARNTALLQLQGVENHYATTELERELIKTFRQDPAKLPLPKPQEAPPGMPIGDEEAPLW
ncbi:MAG: zinc-dependent metalloprotease [Bryobacter sp.]|nr:zinc-dependent metalloprotease [Bryobacter sp.]